MRASDVHHGQRGVGAGADPVEEQRGFRPVRCVMARKTGRPTSTKTSLAAVSAAGQTPEVSGPGQPPAPIAAELDQLDALAQWRRSSAMCASLNPTVNSVPRIAS